MAPIARKGWVVRLHYCSAVLAAAAIVAVLGGIGVTNSIGGLFDVVLIGLSLGVVAGIVFLFSLWMDGQIGGRNGPSDRGRRSRRSALDVGVALSPRHVTAGFLQDLIGAMEAGVGIQPAQPS